MTFDWAEYLTLAEALYANRKTFSNEEACSRSAISRALLCRLYDRFTKAKTDGIVLTNREQHKSVRRHFANGTDQDRQSIGSWLDRLQDNRLQADYTDEITGNIDSMTQVSLQGAKKVIETIKRLT